MAPHNTAGLRAADEQGAQPGRVCWAPFPMSTSRAKTQIPRRATAGISELSRAQTAEHGGGEGTGSSPASWENLGR